MGGLSVHCPGPAPVTMGADDQVGECPALAVVFVDIAVAVADAVAVLYVCINHRSFIFQSSSGIERLGHEGRKDMGRLGSWMQPHIDRIGERVGQVRVMKSTFGDGEEEKRTV